MEELARQNQSYGDAYNDPDNVSWFDFTLVLGGLEMPLVPSLRRHVARQIKGFKKTEPAQRRFRECIWGNASSAGGDGVGGGGKIQARMGWRWSSSQWPRSRPWERKEGWWRGRGPANGAMTSLLAAILCPSDGVAASLVESEGLGVALPCASAKPSRFNLEVYDGCLYVGCKLSPRDWAIIKELNETDFAKKILETGGIDRSQSCEK